MKIIHKNTIFAIITTVSFSQSFVYTKLFTALENETSSETSTIRLHKANAAFLTDDGVARLTKFGHEVDRRINASKEPIVKLSPVACSIFPTPANSTFIILSQAVSNNSEDNNIPKSPITQKSPKVLKNPAGQEYHSDISETSKVTDRYFYDKKAELEKRELIKLSKSAAVKIFVEGSDETIQVGNKNQDYTYTRYARAFFEDNKKVNSDVVIENIDRTPLQDLKDLVIIIPKKYGTSFIKPAQHMLAARSSSGEYFYIFGILTSKEEGLCITISKTQFNIFQKTTLQDPISPEKLKNPKTQQLLPSENFKVLCKENAHIVTHCIKYFDSLSEDTKDEIIFTYNKLLKNPFQNYEPEEKTDEQLFELCKKIDVIARDPKLKFPETADYKKQKADAHLAGKQKQEKFKADNKEANELKYAQYKKK